MACVYAEKPVDAEDRLACCTWTAVTDGAGATFDAIPDGCVEVIREPDGETVVYGPAVLRRRLRLAPGRRAGVRLRPATASTLVRDVATIAGHVVTADRTRLGRLDGCAEPQDWCATILRRLRALAAAEDPLARTAVDLLALRPQQPLSAVAEAVELSERQLRRRFASATGMSPAAYRRLARVRQVRLQAPSAKRGDWARIAAELGFADQAHLVKEVRRITGVTPATLVDALLLG